MPRALVALLCALLLLGCSAGSTPKPAATPQPTDKPAPAVSLAVQPLCCAGSGLLQVRWNFYQGISPLTGVKVTVKLLNTNLTLNSARGTLAAESTDQNTVTWRLETISPGDDDGMAVWFTLKGGGGTALGRYQAKLEAYGIDPVYSNVYDQSQDPSNARVGEEQSGSAVFSASGSRYGVHFKGKDYTVIGPRHDELRRVGGQTVTVHGIVVADYLLVVRQIDMPA